MEDKVVNTFKELVQATKDLDDNAIAYELRLRKIDGNISIPENVEALSQRFNKEKGNPAKYIIEWTPQTEEDEITYIKDCVRKLCDRVDRELKGPVSGQRRLGICQRIKHVFWRLYRLTDDYVHEKHNLSEILYRNYLKIERPQSSELNISTGTIATDDQNSSHSTDPPQQQTIVSPPGPIPGDEHNDSVQTNEFDSVNENNKGAGMNDNQTNSLQSTGAIPKSSRYGPSELQTNDQRQNEDNKGVHPKSNTVEPPSLHTQLARFPLFGIQNDGSEQRTNHDIFCDPMMAPTFGFRTNNRPNAYGNQQPQYENSRSNGQYDAQNDINTRLMEALETMIRGNTSGRVDHGKELIKRRILYTATTEGQPIDIYFGMLAQYVRLAHMTETELMDIIHVTLKGTPSTWYWTSFTTHTERTFEKFQQGLNERFEEVLDGPQLLLKAAEMKYQGSGDVMIHIEKIATILKRGSIPESIQVDVIRNSLTDDMKRMLITNKITTVMDLISCMKKLFPKNCPSQTSAPRKFTNQYFGTKPFSKLVSAIEAMEKESEKSDEISEQDNGDEDVYELAAFIKQYNHHQRAQSNKNGNRKTGNTDKYSKCHNCQEMGHQFKTCTKEQTRFFCFCCGKEDQIATTCDSQACAARRANPKN